MNKPTRAPEPTEQATIPVPDIHAENEHIAICKIILASNPNKKTENYVILNKKSGDLLGEIYWSFPWRQYCFFPESQCTWSTSCLDTVVGFIKGLNIARKVKIGPQYMIQG